MEVQNRQRLLEEFLFPSPVIAAPLALFNRTVQTKAAMSNTTPRNRFWYNQESYTSLQNPLTHGLCEMVFMDSTRFCLPMSSVSKEKT